MSAEQNGPPPLPPPPEPSRGEPSGRRRQNPVVRWMFIVIGAAIIILSVISLVVRLTGGSQKRTVTTEDLAPYTSTGYNNAANLEQAVRSSVLQDQSLLGKTPERTLVNCIPDGPHQFTCVIDQGAEGGLTTKSITVSADGSTWSER